MNVNQKSMELIMKKLDAVYGQSKASDKDAISGYVMALNKYSRLQVARAAMAAAQVEKFYPRPAEIRKQLFVEYGCDVTGRPVTVEKENFDPRDPFDEACMWLMFVRGYTSPDEITEADMRLAAQASDYELQAQDCKLVSDCIAKGYESYEPEEVVV